MNNQRENYPEPSLAKDARKQQMRGKSTQSSLLVTEQEKTYRELKFQNASHYPQWNDRSYQCKCENLIFIAVILGIICFVLMYALVRVITFIPCKLIHNLSSECHCGHCSKDWFTYSNNCYYITFEEKTWNGSLTDPLCWPHLHPYLPPLVLFVEARRRTSNCSLLAGVLMDTL
uniref:Uncharacterized protein n=1 Tax=Ovis aries TaxID=9940 RepID=A0AC11B128_SHEEP